MAQHDQVIDNGPGLTVRTDINAAFAAIFSSSSGTVEPTVKVAGQLWFNTTLGRLQVRNSANTAWSELTSVIGGAVTVTSPATFTGTSASEEGRLIDVRDNRTTSAAVGNAVFGIMKQNSATAALMMGNDGNGTALIGGNNVATRFGKWVTGAFTEYMRVNTDGTVVFTPTTSNSIVVNSTGLEIFGTAPRIRYTDTTASAYSFWTYVDGNTFYILVDRTGDGGWDTPHPLALNANNNTGQLYGNEIYTTANLPAYPTVPPSDMNSTPSTLAMRDGSGDINARLFKSEYDSTNASVNFIMTQIDTATNNYIRPSTPAQVAAALAPYISTEVYNGSDANNTNFPVGTPILAAGDMVRNTAYAIYLQTGNSVRYTAAAGGAQLAGTWRAHGVEDQSGTRQSLMQRTA